MFPSNFQNLHILVSRQECGPTCVRCGLNIPMSSIPTKDS